MGYNHLCNNISHYLPDLKIIDWQFFCAAQPALDFGCMAFYNCHPDVIDQSLDSMYKIYYETLTNSCHLFNVEAPFSLDEFINMNETVAVPLSFIFILFFYDPVGHSMPERVQWLWKRTLEKNPDFLK